MKPLRGVNFHQLRQTDRLIAQTHNVVHSHVFAIIIVIYYYCLITYNSNKLAPNGTGGRLFTTDDFANFKGT